jgi:hypothetical protein
MTGQDRRKEEGVAISKIQKKILPLTRYNLLEVYEVYVESSQTQWSHEGDNKKKKKKNKHIGYFSTHHKA